ncbi:MAG: hypothetical protein LBM26_00255, partial [Methanobrevibacter sp.]|nr:hypothetical protein [Methanobrevibacter sp.]
VNKYIKENNLTKEEQEEIIRQKLELFNLFSSKSFNNARNHFDNMLSKIEDFYLIIQEIMVDSIMPYFNTFFGFLKNNNIESTSNKIENYFHKTMPRHVKKIMKTVDGVMARIWLRTKLWDERNGINF